MRKSLLASLALALATPLGARADTTSDIGALRQEIEAIRAAYETRLQALEQRLKAAEASATTAARTAASAAAVADTRPAPATVAPLAPAAAAGGFSAFNPALSLILSGLYTRTSQDPARYAITGFQLPTSAEAGPGTRGFSLTESD